MAHLLSKRSPDVRAVHRRVAIDAVLAGADSVAAVLVTAEARGACIERRLPVTSQARHGLPGHEELIVYGTVWIVAGCTAVANRVVLENERSSHFLVAAKTFLILAEQHGAARRCDVASVHVMAIRAEHPAFRDGMMVLEHELAFDVKMAGKTHRGVSYQNIAGFSPPVLDVNAPGAVTRLAGFRLSRLGVLIADLDRHARMFVELEKPVLALVAV